MRKNKYKIIVGIIICLILTVAFFAGEAPSGNPQNIDSSQTHIQLPQDGEVHDTLQDRPDAQEQPNEISAELSDESDNETAVNVSDEEPKEENKNDFISANTCTLSVRCDSVFNNLESLADGKEEIIPSDGIIFKEQTVEINDGESVFDVVFREMKKNKIHFEFVDTPMYNSAYIEGIGNLFEFDCGAYSGWLYKVNGIKPNVGCSLYKVQNGDKIEFIYSCNFLYD